jgi:anaerobic selenocysteine-containing dehydrogenase
MAEGKASFFFGMGGNFLSAAPDTDLTARALQQCDMTVHVSTKPNRSHLIHGKEALILPCKGRTEIDEQNNTYQFTSVENSMGKVHSSKGVLPPISKNLKSEVEIVCDLGEAYFGEDHIIEWTAYSKDYDLIRDKIEEVIPGFEQFNTKIREASGFYLPNPARDRRFLGKGIAKFTVNKLAIKSETEQRFKLMTLRSHDQYNTTIYGLNDRYRGISNGRKLIMMNMDDMIKLGLIDQQLVHVHSYHSGKKRSIFNFRVVPYDIPRRCLAAYFPEANPLVSIDHVAIDSNTPVSKNITVEIEKATEM